MTRHKFRFLATCLLTYLFASYSAQALTRGAPAPDFSAKTQDGVNVQLSQYKGKYVLIYFYPKDDTPGCTQEACTFRDEYTKIRDRNAVILGVSRQDEKSHQAFRAKHHLPFDLLVDSDGAIAKAFEIGTMPVIGWTKRQSVLIGPSGKILQIYKSVDPRQHAKQVLADIQAASSGLQ